LNHEEYERRVKEKKEYLNRVNKAYVSAARRKFLSNAPPMFSVMPPPKVIDLTSDFFNAGDNNKKGSTSLIR
jgi:hypothetical protein